MLKKFVGSFKIMDAPERQTSLEEDLYVPSGTPDFSDHFGCTNDIQLINGDLIDVNRKDADYQRFIRIASAQELEELDMYFDSSEETHSYSLSPDSGVHDLSKMDPLLRAKAEEEWRTELNKTEEEIATLRQVLSAKLRHMQELKRKLGITVWKEFRDDMEQGIRNLQETTAYQKTSQTLKSATEKTSEALSTLQATVTKKLEEVKNSSTYKNLEEKVGSTVTNVKTKVGGTETGETSEPLSAQLSEDKNTHGK